MTSAFIFFGGAADLFLSVMLWFILDDERKPIIFVDGDRVHSVEDVIDVNDSSVNVDCNDKEEIEEELEDGRQSLVSKRMIE